MGNKVNPNDIFPSSSQPNEEAAKWARVMQERVVELEKAVLASEGSLQGINRNIAASLAAIGDQFIRVYSSFPVGTVTMFAVPSPPTGWLVCDGSAVSRTDYADLFEVIGTSYGVGDGSTTFNLPDLQGRVPVGLDTGQTEFNTLGKTGGAKTHTLTIDQMPSHSHTQASHSHTVNNHSHSIPDFEGISGASGGLLGVLRSVAGTRNTGGSSPGTSSATPTINATGGGQAHNNLQPYIALPFIIKYTL